MSEEGSMKEMLKPDHSNLKRGFVLVGLAILLGLFMSVQVLTEPDDGIATSDEVASPTVSLAASSTTTAVPTTQRSTTTQEEDTSTSTEDEDETETTVVQPSTTEEAAPTTVATTVAPPTTSAVEVGIAVQVLNGARFSGVASAATDLLQSVGFDPVTPGDTPVVYNESTVFYTTGLSSTAESIGNELNIDNIVQMTSVNQPIDDVEDLDIVVVVGRDETIPR